MLDVFIGLAIFVLGLIVGAIVSCVIKIKDTIDAHQKEDKPIIEPIARKFYHLEPAENDNPDEEDREAKKNRIEDRNFFS